MNIFSLFKKKAIKPTPETIIRMTQEYVPDYYRESRQFKDSQEFLEHNEPALALALDSLIEMAKETNHYFSEAFWTDLADCAELMGMIQQAKYCRRQIDRNKRDLRKLTPKGWTTVKIDDSHFQHYIPAIEKNKWEADRREKDKLQDMLPVNGFYMRSHGRSGYIYYIEDGNVVEIYWEVSGVPQYDILLSFYGLKGWSYPSSIPFAASEKEVIYDKLLKWLKEKNIRTDLEKQL